MRISSEAGPLTRDRCCQVHSLSVSQRCIWVTIVLLHLPATAGDRGALETPGPLPSRGTNFPIYLCFADTDADLLAHLQASRRAINIDAADTNLLAAGLMKIVNSVSGKFKAISLDVPQQPVQTALLFASSRQRTLTACYVAECPCVCD